MKEIRDRLVVYAEEIETLIDEKMAAYIGKIIAATVAHVLHTATVTTCNYL